MTPQGYPLSIHWTFLVAIFMDMICKLQIDCFVQINLTQLSHDHDTMNTDVNFCIIIKLQRDFNLTECYNIGCFQEHFLSSQITIYVAT